MKFSQIQELLATSETTDTISVIHMIQTTRSEILGKFQTPGIFYSLIALAVMKKDIFESQWMDGKIFKSLMLFAIKIMTEDQI